MDSNRNLRDSQPSQDLQDSKRASNSTYQPKADQQRLAPTYNAVASSRDSRHGAQPGTDSMRPASGTTASRGHTRQVLRSRKSSLRTASNASASKRLELAGSDRDSLPLSDNKRTKLNHDGDTPELASSKQVIVDAASLEEREQEMRRLRRTIANQKTQIQQRGEQLKSYRIVNNDRAAEVAGLNRELSDTRQRLADMEPPGYLSVPSEKSRSETLVREPAKHGEMSTQDLKEQVRGLRLELISKDNCLKATRDLVAQLQSSQQTGGLQSEKVADKDTQSLWNQLIFNVRQFVDSYVDTPTMHPSELKHWNNFVSQPRVFFASKDLYPFVFEAHIWSCLVEEVFGARSQAWGGEIGSNFYDVLKSTQGNVARDDQTWAEISGLRARFVNLLDRHKSQPEYTARVQETVVRIRNQVLQPQGAGDLDLEQARQDMQDIVEGALKLDLLLRKSKAIFEVVCGASCSTGKARSRHGLFYDPESWMALHPHQNQHVSKGSKVDMIVSPALFKHGNADGANYGSCKILVKMTVVSGVTGSSGQGPSQAVGKPGEEDRSFLQQDTELPSSQSHDEEMADADVQIASEASVKGKNRPQAHAPPVSRHQTKTRQEEGN